MAKLSRRRLAQGLARLLEAQPQQTRQLLRQTAAYLLHTKQANQSHLLVQDIAQEQFVRRGHLSVQVQSAFALHDTTREALIAMLRHTTGAKTVELSESVVPELIGGVVVRTPQLELDASVKRQLTKLAGGLVT